jgi:hypothetical protein
MGCHILVAWKNRGGSRPINGRIRVVAAGDVSQELDGNTLRSMEGTP